LGAVDEQDPFSLLPLEMVDAVDTPTPSRAQALAALSAVLDSPEVAPLLERLRQAAPPTDLVNGWAPAALQLRRWDKAAERLAAHPDDPVTLNARGIALRRLGRYDAAIADFSRALKLRSSDASLLNNRGIVYARLRRFDDALADLNQALAVRPGDIHSLANRA